MWRNWKIGPTIDNTVDVYAPDLNFAFHLARFQFGSVDLTYWGQ